MSPFFHFYYLRLPPPSHPNLSIIPLSLQPFICRKIEIHRLERECALLEEKVRGVSALSEERIKAANDRVKSMEHDMVASRYDCINLFIFWCICVPFRPSHLFKSLLIHVCHRSSSVFLKQQVESTSRALKMSQEELERQRIRMSALGTKSSGREGGAG
jgi:hypothetical protein